MVAREPDYAPSLPAHIAPDRFRSVITTAINNNPDLLRADRLSLLNACCRAAADGLLPDGREGALVVFGQKATWMPMVQGIIKKILQSGEIASFGARIVYANELDQGRFKYIITEGGEHLTHEPLLTGDRGAPALAYSYARYKSGFIDYEVLTAADIDKVRGVSRSKNSGPWVQWFDEMAKKTVIRRHAKRLPNASEIADLVARDEELTEFEEQRAAARAAVLHNAQNQLGAPRARVVGTEEDEAADDANTIDGEVTEAAIDNGQFPPEASADWKEYRDKIADELADCAPDLIDATIAGARDSIKRGVTDGELDPDTADGWLREFNATALERKRAAATTKAKKQPA